MEEKKFLIRVRLIILEEKKILLSYAGKEEFYFFPGGKVEFGETLKETAVREIKEECNGDFTFIRPLYIRDYFEDKRGISSTISGEIDHHNLEVYILGRVDNFCKMMDSEHPGHEQRWVNLEDLLKIDVRPKQLVEILLKDISSGFHHSVQYLGKME